MIEKKHIMDGQAFNTPDAIEHLRKLIGDPTAGTVASTHNTSTFDFSAAWNSMKCWFKPLPNPQPWAEMDSGGQYFSLDAGNYLVGVQMYGEAGLAGPTGYASPRIQLRTRIPKGIWATIPGGEGGGWNCFNATHKYAEITRVVPIVGHLQGHEIEVRGIQVGAALIRMPADQSLFWVVRLKG